MQVEQRSMLSRFWDISYPLGFNIFSVPTHDLTSDSFNTDSTHSPIFNLELVDIECVDYV